MAYCERCGAKYTPNLFGVVGNTFLGTARLCRNCSPYWLAYYIKSKKPGPIMKWLLQLFLHGLSVQGLAEMSVEEIYKAISNRTS